MALIRDALMADSVGLRDDTVDEADGLSFANDTSVTHALSSFYCHHHHRHHHQQQQQLGALGRCCVTVCSNVNLLGIL